MIKLNLTLLLNEVHGIKGALPSEREIAKGVGISRATVRRFLGKDRGVPDKIDLDVIDALCVYFTKQLEREIGVGDILVRE